MVSKKSILALILAVAIATGLFFGVGRLEKRIAPAAENSVVANQTDTEKADSEKKEILALQNSYYNKISPWENYGFNTFENDHAQWLYFTGYDIQNACVYFNPNQADFSNRIFECGIMYNNDWEMTTLIPSETKTNACTYSVQNNETILFDTGGSLNIQRILPQNGTFVIIKAAYNETTNSESKTVYFVPKELISFDRSPILTDQGYQFQLSTK